MPESNKYTYIYTGLK